MRVTALDRIEPGDRYEQVHPSPSGMTLEVEEVRDDGKVVVRRSGGARQIVPRIMLTDYWRPIAAVPALDRKPRQALDRLGDSPEVDA